MQRPPRYVNFTALPVITIMQANFSKIYCEPKDLLVLVIDEISFVVSSVLHHLDIQLQRLRGVYDVPFGGVILILAGDFHQKAPPQSGNVSLAELLVQETLPELLSHEPLKPHKPSAKGLMHFSRVERTTLSEQMRAAEDPCLQAHLERLRDTNLQQPVTTELLAALKPLSPQDIVDNPAWQFAPVAVLGNFERHYINESQVRAWARTYDVPLIKWKLPLQGKWHAAYDLETIEELYKEEVCLWGFFTRGAPAIP